MFIKGLRCYGRFFTYSGLLDYLVTVRVTALEYTVPAELLTLQRYWQPFLPIVASGLSVDVL